MNISAVMLFLYGDILRVLAAAARIRGTFLGFSYHTICHAKPVLKAGVSTKYGWPAWRETCTTYIRPPKG